MDLDLLGWDGDFAGLFEPWADAGHRPGRVIAAHRGGDLVATASGELLAQATGRLRHLAGPSVAGLPAVGDWVAVRDDRIHAVLPRRTAVTRRMPGHATAEQVLAANVDLVMVVVCRPLPSSRISPVASRSRPARRLTRVDLPTPEEPSSTAVRPAVSMAAISSTPWPV